MTAQEERYFCRACPGGSLPAEALRQAEEYAASLPREQCATGEQYRLRLLACGTCPYLRGGHTCGLCGCFVIVRAKKKGQDCPDPVISRWPRSSE